MRSSRTQSSLRQWLQADAADRPAVGQGDDHDDLAPDPTKLAWMRDSPKVLAQRIPTSVFALGDVQPAAE